jgi:UDP-glucose 4-epimerase
VSRIIPKAAAVAAGRFPHVDVNGDGSARREYIHVLDIADACVQALTGPPDDADVINVGSGYAASIAEVIATARDVTGQAIPTIHHPPSPEPPLVFSDNTLALTRLDWKPTRSNLTRMISDAWTAEQPR